MNETFERGCISQAGRAAGSTFYVDFFPNFFFHERLGRVVNSNSNHAKLSPPLPAWGQVELTPRDVPSPCPLRAPKESPMFGDGDTCITADIVSIQETFPDAARILLTSQTFVASFCSPKPSYKMTRHCKTSLASSAKMLLAKPQQNNNLFPR